MSYGRELMDQVLSRIEKQELRSLKWGFVHGSMGEAELLTLIGEELDTLGLPEDPGLVREEMVNHHLLFELETDEGYRYRSRFAEGVRLLSTLRQILPKQPWLSAPALVADYRVDAQPRAFPRREIPASAVLSALGQTPGWSPLHAALGAALLPETYRLAAFQVRAAQQILRSEGVDRGIVVSAGTGSGKTLAFYLPALVEIGTLVKPGEHWVKAVAIYPRIELLKDQFNEAYRMARQLDPVLTEHNRRPIRMGTFFSLTPTDATVKAVEQAKWPAEAGGYVCPYLSCPKCGDDLIWQRTQLERRVERLVCRKGAKCSGTVTPDQVAFTRRALQAQPPDLLFTTNETLNRRLSDRASRQLLGITGHPNRKVRLVLLDEVHTYEGGTGAQTALVLRRWRHAVRAPLRYVGLSATLREAPQFFGDLVGLDAGSVFEAKPETNELEYRSMVYQVVLRGNPSAPAALLSTSIQASFLMARLLDPMHGPGQPADPYGFYGSRLFAFTDDLDVTNRLFDNLRDAEAYDLFGRPDPKKAILASLRAPTQSGDDWARDRAGQNWSRVEEIGHRLNHQLRITRTSSQDAGVDRTSNVIVATASLEVGFNDPTVGAVLQHKSPHGMAAYLQRKGRAGRPQAMRPWVVTVLSDFGRDRLTYQSYDQLFDPVLSAQRLPVRNRYILRMQAVQALIDWLAETLPGGPGTWMWRVLNGPAGTDKQTEAEQQQVIQRLTDLLQGDGPLMAQLSAYLRGALRLESEEDVASVLWEAPRSLMLELIPTLLRRLQTHWQNHPQLGEGKDIRASGYQVHPLPDFTPASLFSPLNVPDVIVVIPPATIKHEERIETMGIVQALNQLVPGRITRRFAHERGNLYHWVPVPLAAGENPLSIAQFAEQYELVANVPNPGGTGEEAIPVYRPWTVRLERVSERKVSPTSNGSLHWHLQILPQEKPTTVDLSHAVRWSGALGEAAFFLHNFRAPVTTRRFATGATTSVRQPNTPDSLIVETSFTTGDGKPAAVGFEQAVDGMRLALSLPDRATLLERVSRSPNVPAWRVAYFRDLVLNDPELGAEVNLFQREWVYQIYLATLVARAAQSGLPLAEACEQMHQEDLDQAFCEVMDAIFQIDPTAAADPESDDGSPSAQPGQQRSTLRERLAELLERPEVAQRLMNLAKALWEPEPQRWGDWLSTKLAETMGEAVLQACQRIAPSYVATDSLLIDVVVEPPATEGGERSYALWVTESSQGGVGALEAIAVEAISNPRALLSALDAALAPGDMEAVAVGLESFVRLTQVDPEVAAAADDLRRSKNHAEHQRQFRALVALAARRGVSVDLSLSVALHQRLFRPGSGAGSDMLVVNLLDNWQQLEKQLGVTIDLRLFSYLAVNGAVFADRVEELLAQNTGSGLSPAERVSALTGFLWPQPAAQRGRSLQSYSPFHWSGWTDPSLVRDLLIANHVRTVAFGEPDWHTQVEEALSEMSMVRLQAATAQEGALHRALYRLLALPISVQYLQFYMVIEQVDRDDEKSTVTLVLKEIM